MEMESACLWVTQNDGFSRNNEATIPKFWDISISISNVSVF